MQTLTSIEKSHGSRMTVKSVGPGVPTSSAATDNELPPPPGNADVRGFVRTGPPPRSAHFASLLAAASAERVELPWPASLEPVTLPDEGRASSPGPSAYHMAGC